MDHQEAQKTLEAIARWMELREQGGYSPVIDRKRFLIEAEHSLRGGLLYRLLIEEKEPLEHTPPLAFSRPWYSLIEDGEAVVEKDLVYGGVMEDTIAICQHQWHIVKKDQDGSYLVRWRPGKDGRSHWGEWRLVPTSDAWVFSRMG